MRAPYRQELGVNWRFGGSYCPGSEMPGFDDSGFETVSVPHTVVPLGWRDWRPESWEHQWIYRRDLQLPEVLGDGRWVLDFGGVLTGCSVWLNGAHLVSHLGGYLGFRAELSGYARPGHNLLAVVVDGRWLNVPPQGRPGGARSIDFFEPAGIYREVTLSHLPLTSVREIFVASHDVLSPSRRWLEVTCSVEGLEHLGEPAELQVLVRDGRDTLAKTSVPLGPASGHSAVRAELRHLEALCLWDIEAPKLYDLEASIKVRGRVLHSARERFGLREARWEATGFYLNGRRLQLVGLNRHQLFPFQAMAMPRRAQRRDAELLKRYLHCNMVRCSHYPQSVHFLDACDELGLLVWEEVPGWGYVGDDNWQASLLRDVAAMVRRDRNRPAVVIWGVQANESPENPALYLEAKRIAYELDGTRATSGSTLKHSAERWVQDVFAFDDYFAGRDGEAALEPPLDGVPYLVAEAVGALTGHPYYRRDDPQKVQQDQALFHARAIDKASSDPRYAGVLGWCAIDYASANGRAWRQLKWPGVLDTFRVPKPGAAIYRSQVPPSTEVVVEPAFYWYFGEGLTVADLDELMFCSNCDELVVLVGGHSYHLLPDRQRFAHLAWPPFFLRADALPGPGAQVAELVVHGYLAGELAVTRRFSADTSYDRLDLAADDTAIEADGVDLTRVVVRVTDRYGSTRPKAEGVVRLFLDGPGELIGEREWALQDGGAVRAVWLRGRLGEPGQLHLVAAHALYGQSELYIDSLAWPPELTR